MRTEATSDTSDRSAPGTSRRWLRVWHIAFGVLAAFFAVDYIRRGMELASRGELVKGVVWAVIAVAMILPDLVGWLRRRARPR